MVVPGVISIENGKREDLAIVIVTSDELKLIGYCEVIRQELGQREVTY